MAIEYDELLQKLTEIRDSGYIESHRTDDTGIGKTLEDLLGIRENNIALPDLGTYELKSGRRQSKSMMTLFTKVPSPEGATKALVDKFGYRQRKQSAKAAQAILEDSETEEAQVHLQDKELHVTVDSIAPNSVGLQLDLVGDRLYFKNNQGVEAYYDRDTLMKAFEKVYGKVIYVIADCRKVGKTESFLYDEAYLLEGFEFGTFTSLIREGVMKVDLRIGHYPDGRVHDHGTGFRILPVHFHRCFKVMKRIM